MRLRLVAAATLTASLVFCAWPGGAAAQPADGNDAEVVAQLMQVLERSPRRGAALDRLYGLHVERGRLDQLLATLRQRTTDTPSDGTAWMIAGLLESQRGRDAAAVTAFSQAEKHRPKDALASFYLGQSLVLVGRPAEAAEAFERAIARSPARADLLDIYQALGRVHQRARQTEKAIEVWKRLEQRFPDDRRVQEQIANALAEEGQHQQALTRYEALVKAARDANDSLKEPLFRAAVADLKAQLGRRDDALSDYEALLADLPPDDWKHADVRARLEEVFLRADDLVGLARYYEARVAKHPEDLGAVSRLAAVLVEQGRVSDAIGRLSITLERAPRNTALRLDLIHLLVGEQKTAEAAAQYEVLNKHDPNNPDHLREWGLLLLRDTTRPEDERRKRAAEVWRRLLPAPGQKEDPVRLGQVADLFRQGGLTDDALALYRRAAELAPGPSPPRVHLGEFLNSLGRKEEALATWRAMAEGPYRDVRNLRHLAEVLAGFGYQAEALAVVEDACLLDAKDFGLRLLRAELLHQAARHADALAQLDEAARLAPGPEESELVLDRQLRTHQSGGTLSGRIIALQKELAGDANASPVRRYELARFAEAARQWPEAAAAIRETLKGQKELEAARRLNPARAAAARIHEGAGDLAAAATAFRQLADSDRSRRAEHLAQVMRLEERLGRRAEALAAGRDLIAAAPDNLAHGRTFASLCVRLGETEEGLEVLRRAVRLNPNDPESLTALARALAEQFRTAEAIELYWRVFDKADGDGKLTAIDQLASLHLRSNQFDRLLERLDRLRRAPATRRLAALSVARAHVAAGDLGTARKELEQVLAESANDISVLRQLASLAERENDLTAAVRYLRLLARSDRSVESQLASLLLRSGETEEAVAIWQRQAATERRADRLLQLADNLLLFQQYDRAVPVVASLLRDQPQNWEALYRQGLLLAGLGKMDEAEKSFRAILALQAPDDELSELIQQRPAAAKSAAAKSAPPKGVVPGPTPRPTKDADNAVLDRVQAVALMRPAIGLTPSDSTRRSLWSPGDFGQARMAALGWLWVRAQTQKRQDGLLAELRLRCQPDGLDLRPWWDFWYLSLVRGDPLTGVEARQVLVKSGLPAVYWYYINGIGERGGARPTSPTTLGAPARPATATLRPLPPGEIDKLLLAYDVLCRRRPDWVFDHIYEKTVAELTLAGRNEEAEKLYRDSIASATVPILQLVMMRVAGQRGDLDTFTQLLGRFEPLRNTPAAANLNPTTDLRHTFQKVMDARVEANSAGDVGKLLELFLDYHARTTRADRAAKIGAAVTPPQPIGRVIFSLKSYQRPITMDFPAPGTYLDRDSLYVLGNTLMLYHKADLVSDLFALMRARVERAKPEDRAHESLALAAFHWWNGNRDEAAREAARAVESAPGDAELRLELARAQLALNRPDEALATIDATAAADSATLQYREWAALEAASRTGNTDRARQAAERLGGLRLDAESLTRLAGRMHQLGMPQEANAALARARSQAGGRNEALLALMRQYRAQNQTDKAAEVGVQILRGTPAGQLSPDGFRTPVAQARQEALQALAASGRLVEMISRAESQLKTSPRSLPLLQTLAEYYQAGGNKAKVKDVYERMAKLKPDDPGLRYQLAEQIAQTDPAAALEHYLAAIRKQPRLFYFNSYFIVQRFQAAGKLAALGAAIEEVDLRQAGISDVSRLAQSLMADEKTKAAGLRLFRKLWDAAGAERESVFAYLDAVPNSAIWSMPEIYDMVRQAVVPRADETLADPWARFGRLVPRLATLAEQRGQMPQLTREVQDAVDKRPEWTGGKALVAVLDLRSGRADRAKPVLQTIFDDKNVAVPPVARDVLVQEMEQAPMLQELAIQVCERAIPESLSGDRYSGYSSSLMARLVELYKRNGRTSDARVLLRKLVRANLDQPSDSPGGFENYTRRTNLNSLADQLLALDSPLDAARIHGALLAEVTNRSVTGRPGFDDYELRQAREKLDEAIKALSQAAPADLLREALLPRETKGDGPILDLSLLINPRESDRASLQSLLTMALQSSAESGLPAEVRSRLDELAAKYPRDFAVQVAAAVPLLARADGPDATKAVQRLEELVGLMPLETLPPGSRANARQRAAAAEQVPLWLAARPCLKSKNLRDAGRRLADRAADAAARQIDNGFALAIQREWGQLELEAGDKEAAARHWGTMLDMTLGQARGPKGVAITLETFLGAVQVAKLAAANGQMPLSFRAVGESLRAGPPVVALPKGPDGPRFIGVPEETPESRIGNELRQLEQLWQKHGAAARDVYEALSAAVLPAGRPAEVFPYPAPLVRYSFLEPAQARSAATSLADWAARAGRTDDLRKRVEARMSGRLAEVPARTVLVQLGRTSGDRRLVADALDWLEKRLNSDGTRPTAELVCHAALPLLDDPADGKAARSAAARAAATLATSPDGKMLAMAIHLQIAKSYLRAGDRATGRHHVREFLRLDADSPGESSDYKSMVQRSKLWLATKEFADAGLWDDAWEALGQAIDLPASNFDDSVEPLGLVGPLARGLAGRPATDRYSYLKAWVLPSPTHKAVRLVVGPAGDESVPPAAFGKFVPPPTGLVSSYGLLIDAARETGKLDELEAEVRAAVDAKAANAESLLRQIRIARGRGKEVQGWVRERADVVVKKLAGALPGADPEYSFPRRTPGYPAAERSADLVLALACLADPVLREAGEKMAVPLADNFQRTEYPYALGMRVGFGGEFYLQGFGTGDVVQSELAALRATRATGMMPRSPVSGPALWFDDRPRTADRPLSGWLAHEGYLTNLPGSARRLHFAYPIAGTFELSFEASNLGYVEYGGRMFNPFGSYGSFRSRLATGPGSDFRRFNLQVTPERVRCLVDGRQVFEDAAPDPASPWLVLAAGSGGQPVFRKLSLTGNPKVQREVPLVRGDRLSWSAEMAEARGRRATATVPLPIELEARRPEPAWSATGGVISGRRDDSQPGRLGPSQLQLSRPLRPGESVSYEFLYEPDRTAVFPSLDRLAFVLGPDGMRLHWVRGDEAYGLKEDNSALDPDGHRGPDRLPLRTGEWNEIKLTLDGDLALFDLNGVRVHEHKLDPANNRRFGLFHFQSRTEAKARSLLLRGPWPETLPADRVADLTAPATPPTQAERRLRHALIGDDVLAGGSLDLVRRARGLEMEARYELLRGWVLPGLDHPTIRLNGGFTPLEPAPPDAGDNGRGGAIESPARELVATADRLGRLPELAKLVEAATVESDRDRRGQSALSAMIAVAAGRDADANALLATLKESIAKVSAVADESEFWPELSAALAAGARPATRAGAVELLGAVVERLGTTGTPMGLAGHARAALAMLTNEGVDPEPRTPAWHATALPTALSRSAGRPRPVWTIRGGELMNHTGHPDDIAFFSVPLRGDFEVVGELTLDSRRSARLAYGDLVFELTPDGKQVRLTQPLRSRYFYNVPPLKPNAGWIAFRFAVQGGTCTLYADGRSIANERLPIDSAPWLSIRPGPNGGGIRQVKVTGKPVIPEALDLSGPRRVAGWTGRYYGETFSEYSPTWEWRGNEIRAKRDRDGTPREKLLQYVRPMLEDGDVEYEFWPAAGNARIHPALDRMALLIADGSVQIHWLTNGEHERSGLAIDNRVAGAAGRVGPATLPLKADAWNKVRVGLIGNRMTLSLNGVDVFQYDLEPTNRRVFGLFHEPEAGDAQVRNVRYRGAWKKELPPFE